MNLMLIQSATYDEETESVTLTFFEQWDNTKQGGPVDFQPTKQVIVTLPNAVVIDLN